MAAEPQLTVYAELVEVTESMCGVVRAGHLEELPALEARARVLGASLPATPPNTAEPALRRLQLLTAQLEVDLKTSIGAIADELGDVDRSRAAGRAYRPGGASAPSASRIDTAA